MQYSLLDKTKWWWSHWRPFKARMVLIIILSAANAWSMMVIPLAMKWILDGIQNSFTTQQLTRASGVLLGLAFLRLIFSLTAIGQRAWMNTRLEWSFRQRLYEHITRMSPRFMAKYPTGDLVTRMTDDIQEKLTWFSCSGVFRTWEALVTIVAGLILMLSINVKLTLYTVGWMPLLIILFIKVSSLLLQRYTNLQNAISRLNETLEACFSAIRVVKAFNREEAQYRNFRQVADERKDREIETVQLRAIIESMYANVWQVGVIFVLLIGGAMVIEGSLTLGELVAFDAYVIYMVFPMYDIGNFFVRGRQAAVSIERLMELENFKPEVTDVENANAPAKPTGVITYDNVSVKDNGWPLIEDISLQIEPGLRIGMVGKIGSGKSTALRLLPRLIDPSEGRISLDGIPYRELSLDFLRKSIGYVPQEPILFSDTLINNIIFGREEVTPELASWAAEAAQLTLDLDEFPKGLDTLVGQKGVTLSGGQKQRVALARALAGKPKILILDDCTSALDAETEAALWARLAEVMPGLTCFISTHRVATLETSDMIYVFDDGRLVEQGTHAYLMDLGGVYKMLYYSPVS